MLVVISLVMVVLCVFGSFAFMGGHLAVLWQPFEFIIIFGSAVCAYIISNPKTVLIHTLSSIKRIFSGPQYAKADYLELLSVLYSLFKLAKSKGMLAIEPHIENPEESSLFTQFPKFMSNHHAVTFLCDYLRMITMGTENPHQVEDLMNEELEVHHEEEHGVPHALQTMADGMPALGIVAAVLGVIHTMGSINEPPAVLGGFIAAALVGTFLGILLAYGFVGPLASGIGNVVAADSKYMQCMKAGILAHMSGYAPAISIEFARKALYHDVRPTFFELEEAINELPAAS